MGWLESPSKSAAPLEALNIFTLSLHKELMAVEDDEKLMEATREALGQVNTNCFFQCFLLVELVL